MGKSWQPNISDIAKNESMSDFIRRLERTFRLAYGHVKMLAETRDALASYSG